MERVKIAVVGAGPAGLASALTLGEYGLNALVIERRHEASRLPRANTLSTGTMELMRRWDLEDAVRERALDVEMQPLAIPTLSESQGGRPIEAGFPTRAQAAVISPTAPAAVGQDELEPILESRVRALPSVRLQRGVEVVALERHAASDEIVLTLAGPGPRRRRVRADYVIGADGVRGSVRRALGIPTAQEQRLDERLALHFRAPLWELVGDRRHAIYFLTSAPEERSILPIGRPDRWVYARPWNSATDDIGAVDDQLATTWIREAAGVDDLRVEVLHTSVVDYGVSLAARFREGNAFLVGDAAHRVTPRGATGLNTAIRDGFDLGWKLAWVLHGWSDRSLLDTYERERRPVAEFNTGRSARADGSVLANAIGLNADIGGRIPHVWVWRKDRLVSSLDLLGPGMTLFAGPEWDGSRPGPVGPAGLPVAVENLDAIAARGLGLGPAGVLLARPDGHPFQLWNEGAPRETPGGHQGATEITAPDSVLASTPVLPAVAPN